MAAVSEFGEQVIFVAAGRVQERAIYLEKLVDQIVSGLALCGRRSKRSAGVMRQSSRTVSTVTGTGSALRFATIEKQVASRLTLSL